MMESSVDGKLNRIEHNYVIISIIIPKWCNPNLIDWEAQCQHCNTGDWSLKETEIFVYHFYYLHIFPFPS